jgi:hypothetical protein
MKEIIKSFFYNSDGKFQPIYAYSFIFLLLTIIIIVCRLISPLGHEDKIKISDTLILGMMTYILALIGLYNYTKSKGDDK